MAGDYMPVIQHICDDMFALPILRGNMASALQAGSTSTRPEMGSELASPSTIASIPPSPDYAQLQQVNNAPAVQPSDADAAKRKAEGSRRYSQVLSPEPDTMLVSHIYSNTYHAAQSQPYELRSMLC